MPDDPIKPGDDAEAGTPSTGEDVCPRCNGEGVLGEEICPQCLGTGTVVRGIGGG